MPCSPRPNSCLRAHPWESIDRARNEWSDEFRARVPEVPAPSSSPHPQWAAGAGAGDAAPVHAPPMTEQTEQAGQLLATRLWANSQAFVSDLNHLESAYWTWLPHVAWNSWNVHSLSHLEKWRSWRSWGSCLAREDAVGGAASGATHPASSRLHLEQHGHSPSTRVRAKAHAFRRPPNVCSAVYWMRSLQV
mmetsp:Transcript_90813/g.257247  ORF Transcript_90813/g.257247 Transcript_90813/m.257247 type:complete len:191 (-) Transcript_90813:1160-1732(-)